MRTLTALCALAALTSAQLPQLESVRPRGGQRGTTLELHLRGRALDGARELVFDTPGLSAGELDVKDDRRVHADVAIAPDCPLGPHAVWVRTARGLSSLGTFGVGALPELEEQEPNGTNAEAQAIELDQVINGVASTEDLDLFRFEGKAGTRVAVEIEGLRLGDRLFDPAVALLDEAGFALASCDDIASARQDAILDHVLPADGAYYVSVREAAYRGNDNSRYRLHVGRFPRPLSSLPLGGAPGEELPLTLLGAAGEAGALTAVVPAARPSGGLCPEGVSALWVEDERGIAPGPLWLRTSALARAAEVEPNDEPEQAFGVEAPCAVEGVLGVAGDLDRFEFDAVAGTEYDVVVWARRLRSPIDAVLDIDKVGAGRVASNDDDEGHPDSRVRFRAEEAGRYRVSLRDQLRRGGPEFTYRVEITPVAPRLRLEFTETLDRAAVPRGGRSLVPLRVERVDISGPIEVSIEGLPAGVSASIPTIQPGTDLTLVVLEAEAEAPDQAALCALVASQEERAVEGGLWHDVVLITGQNQSLFWGHTIDRMPLAVTEPAPFRLNVRPLGVPLVQDGSQRLVIEVERDEGYEGEVTLTLPFRPPGVSAPGSVRVAAGAREAGIELSASGSARVGDWQLAVVGQAVVDGASVQVCSALTALEIAAPFVRFTAQASSVERGQATQMLVAIERLEGFAGTATVELVGLPHGVSSDALELGPETNELIFALRTADDSPKGRHRGLAFRARFTLEAGEVPHALPAAELRIQQPTPAVASAPTQPEQPAAEEAAPVERPPTRLEKLRAEHAALLESLQRAEEERARGEAEEATPGEAETVSTEGAQP